MANKLSIVIADTNAMPSAFVVLRGFEQSIRLAGELGYEGVELALKSADEVRRGDLDRLLSAAGVEVSAISTGQVYAARHLSFTDADESKRNELRDIFRGMIDLASDYGQKVNIGRVRGSLDTNDPLASRDRFVSMARELADYADTKGVTLLLEPVNRYELNFVNSVAEGAELMERVGRPNMKLMPDLFHMNIEDATFCGELARYRQWVGYVHFADSNRLSPGKGHTDFQAVLKGLKEMNYDGWLSVEVLPIPDGSTAARDAIAFLKPLMEQCHA